MNLMKMNGLNKLILFVILFFANFAFSINYSGTYYIGATGTWTNLNTAIASLKNVSNTITGPVVLEIQSDYNEASEVYPLVFSCI